MNYREITLDDAKNFIELNISLARETEYMLLTPAEAALTILEQEQRIKDFVASHDRVVYVAEEDGKFAGFIGGTRGNFERNRHSCTLVLGVLKQYRRRGVATALMQCLLRWADEYSVQRLELTVLVSNTGAVDFYKANGFLVEGRRRLSIRLNNEYVDEYFMARLLSY